MMWLFQKPGNWQVRSSCLRFGIGSRVDGNDDVWQIKEPPRLKNFRCQISKPSAEKISKVLGQKKRLYRINLPRLKKKREQTPQSWVVDGSHTESYISYHIMSCHIISLHNQSPWLGSEICTSFVRRHVCFFMVGDHQQDHQMCRPIPFVASGMSFFGSISSPYTWGVQLQHVGTCCNYKWMLLIIVMAHIPTY